MSSRNPFDDLEQMLDRMTRQFQQLEPDGSVPVDLLDRGDEFEVQVDLPGYQREEIDVQLTENALRVSAERAEDIEATEGEFLRRERSRRSASRSLRLPEPVDEEGANATYENGVLTVTLPKRGPQGDEGTDIPVN